MGLAAAVSQDDFAHWRPSGNALSLRPQIGLCCSTPHRPNSDAGAFTRSASVTVPATPSASPPPQSVPAAAAAPPPPPASPVSFPLEWILANAAAPLQYRGVVDVARLADRVGPELSTLPLTYRPALMLAATQSADGTWNRAMLSVPGPRAEHF